MAANWNGID